jgi:hypothetical protein
MPAKNLRTLVEGAYKNSVSVQLHRISREDAARVKEAEKIGHNQAVNVLLEILFKVAPNAVLKSVGFQSLTTYQQSRSSSWVISVESSTSGKETSVGCHVLSPRIADTGLKGARLRGSTDATDVGPPTLAVRLL